MTSPSKRGPHLQLVAGDHLARAADERSSSEPLPLDQAYRQFAPYVAAIAGRIMGHDADLDDLVQDVFLEATRGIAALRDAAAIKGWLGRIAVRAAVRRLRRRRVLRALHLQAEAVDYESVISLDATPEQRALIVRVYRALEALGAQDRAAWVLRHVHGESLEGAAKLCGCSLSTYQRRLRRAATYLREELTDD